MLTTSARGRLRSVVADERPHFRPPIETFRDERLERRRHLADDDELLIVHRNDAADGGAVGIELSTPESVAEDHHLPARGRIFVDAEITDKSGTDAERVEEVR